MDLLRTVTNAVVVEGRLIPRLTANEDIDGSVELVLDGRFAATFTRKTADQAAWLIANALAIGEGYPCLSAESKDRPFAAICKEIGGDSLEASS